MKGFKKYLKFIFAALACVCAVPCTVSPVFANSGHRYEFGVSGSGILTPHENSVLAVESEKLTFNIPDFPKYGNSLSNYNSTVTAEYEFVNTSDSAVVTSMAFPIGVDPYYYGDLGEPEIMVNDTAVTVQTRHTLGNYRYFTDRVKHIYDDYYSDDFYAPDTEVTHYEITIEMPASGYRLIGNVDCGNGARFITWLGTEDEIDKYLDKGKNVLDVYVVGDTADFNCVWHFEKLQKHLFSGGEYVKTDRTFPINENIETTTLKDFILSYRPQDSVVSEMDWYNGFVSDFGNRRKCVSECALATCNDYYFLAWYTYDVQAEPNGRFTNTVTVPLLPSENGNFSPTVYDYEYYLSPAKSWKSFGALEIEINTDYYLIGHSIDFVGKDGGFVAELDGLPESELYFSLCSEAVPTKHHVGVDLTGFVIFLLVLFSVVALIFVGAIIVAIVYLVKSKKKR